MILKGLFGFKNTQADVTLEHLDVTDVMNGSPVHAQILLQCKFLAADLTLVFAFPLLTVCQVVVNVDC